MRIVIASDSFKGCLDSMQVADAVSAGIRDIYPCAEIMKVKIADGGEGTTDAIMESVDGERVNVYVHDPLGRKIKAGYGIIENGRTAVIEAAAASGLTLLAPAERNPMLASTFGTGEMIADALRRGCRKFMICLGGSATNDCGLGMLAALGYRFRDEEGRPTACNGAGLNNVYKIDETSAMPELHESEFTIACDVDNPLFGSSGAAHIFAPQKGADEGMVAELDMGLRKFAERIMEYTGKDVSEIPGSGAAGGLGGAFMAFLNARAVRGIDMVLNGIGFDKLISGCDLVITGEGRIDGQTAMGKAAYGVLKRAMNQGIKTLAIGGGIDEGAESSGFDDMIRITPADMPLEKAMQPEIAKSNIKNAITEYLSRR